LIGIADADEVRKLKNFVDSSTTFIRPRSWAVEGMNDRERSFKKSLFEAPDFTSVHG
jgi:dipeptidyl-peptidase-3